MQSTPPLLNLEVIREAVHELFGPSLRQVRHLEFYNPYPKAIDRDNPYSRGYRIPKFSLISREMDSLPWSMWLNS